VTRILRGVTVPPDDFSVTLALIGGPTEGGLTEEQLKLAWEAYGGDDLMLKRPGARAWAYWKFEVGEEPPDDDHEPIRLAELGLLRDDEIAAIAERANEGRARIGTGAEHYGWGGYYPDREAVELHEAVKRALEAP
jgi:hypothetical protein